MALNGLESVKKFVPNAGPSIGDLDVSQEVDETTAMLKYLGVVGDEDKVRETLTADYRTLKGTLDNNGRNIEGRLYIAPSIDVLPRDELLKAVSHILGEDNLYVDPTTWTPTKGKTDGFTAAQLKKAAPRTEPAMALHSVNKGNPLLHFTSQPFDDVSAKPGKTTQLESLADFKQEFEARHLDRLITPLNHVAVLGMAIEDKIAGRDRLPIDWGFMRDASLPRVSADGDSIVGGVSSRRSWVSLSWSHGRADGSGGVGVSMGLKKS